MKRLYSKISEQLGTTDVVAQWRNGSDLLAVAGWKRRVTIYDRAGTALADINLPDPDVEYDSSRLNAVLALEWHPSGRYLAVLPRGQHFAMVWNAESHEVARVDADVRPVEATLLLWHPSAPQLLLGSAKGAAVVYDCEGRGVTRLPAKLGKAICSGAWVEAPDGAGDSGSGGAPSSRSYLVLGSRDQQVAWFDPGAGELLRLVSLRGVPSEIRTYVHPDGRRVLLSASTGRRSLLVLELPAAAQPDSAPPPLELSFQERYGELESHLWLEGGCVLAGFRTGQVAVVAVEAAAVGGRSARSGHSAQQGTEIYSCRALPYAITSMSCCAATQQVALVGGPAVGILQWDGGQRAQQVESDWAELEGGQLVSQAAWSPDGSLLTVTTKGGKLHQYLVRAPSVHAVHGSRVAYTGGATSLTDATVVDLKAKQLPATVRLRAQPDALALGPLHLAAISGNKVAYHSLAPGEDGLLPPPSVVDYPVPIRGCHLNQTHAVLLGQGGQVYVQALGEEGSLVELRGDDGESYEASCIALTQRCIVVGLADGTLAFYDCAAHALVSEYRHAGGSVAALYPDHTGARLVLQDGSGAAFLYEITDGSLTQPPNFEGALAAAVWHADDPNLLALVSDAGAVHCYLYIPASVEGRGLKHLGTQPKPHGAAPLVLHGACLTCRLPAGAHEDVRLAALAALDQGSNACEGEEGGRSRASWEARCSAALSLCRFPTALAAAQRCADPTLLREVAVTALHVLDVPTAVEAYRAAGDEAAAAALEPLCGVKDASLLAARCIVALGGDVDRAEELMLASSQPLAALELRKQLGHWEAAYELAQELDPAQSGLICLARAEACEAKGEFEEAAAGYREALASEAVRAEGATALGAEAGLARCSIEAGEFETGAQLALRLANPALSVHCAQRLEARGQARLAADLHAAAGQYDAAAELYLRCREFRLADGVIGQATDPAVRLRYAEAKEDLGSFVESAAAYLEAGQPLRAVRVYLQRLGDVQAATKAAEGSTEGALLVAQHCAAARQFKLAVGQFCAAGAWDDALALAQQQGEMEEFCAQVRTRGEAGQALRLAEQLERAGDLPAAAEFAAVAGQYERAAQLYLRAGSDSVEQAIALAATGRDGGAVAAVVAHLQATKGMAERLIELHLAVGQAGQACAVAVARAGAEQAAGNYKLARDQLLRVCTALHARRAPATPELLRALGLLHSYLLVKTLVRLGDHLGAARLLLRVADGISAFPKHVVPILTSAVIECHRAGLHSGAHKWARALAEPGRLGLVAEPYRNKVEALARGAPPGGWDAPDPAPADCECLFCGAPGPETELGCGHCGANIPFCLATGMRLTLADASECPACRFPCRGTALAAAVGRDAGVCPLCEQPVAVHAIKKVFDPIAQLRRSVFAGTLPGPGGQR